MLTLETTTAAHQEEFIAAAQRSTELHKPWVYPPLDARMFRAHLDKYDGNANLSFLALDANAALVACININGIARGALQSAYLGYYAFQPWAGKGLMPQAMRLVMSRAFNELALHRLEANIQPGNRRSIRLVTGLGFRHEGFSPRYLQINGEWRDHERFAITAEEFTW